MLLTHHAKASLKEEFCDKILSILENLLSKQKGIIHL
jgi:hypothetical protein